MENGILAPNQKRNRRKIQRPDMIQDYDDDDFASDKSDNENGNVSDASSEFDNDDADLSDEADTGLERQFEKVHISTDIGPTSRQPNSYGQTVATTLPIVQVQQQRVTIPAVLSSSVPTASMMLTGPCATTSGRSKLYRFDRCVIRKQTG